MVKLSAESVKSIKAAITRAKTMEEIDRLEAALKSADMSLVTDLVEASTPSTTPGNSLLEGAWDTKRKSPVDQVEEQSTPKRATLPTPVASAPLAAHAMKPTSSVALSLLFDKAKHDPSYAGCLYDSHPGFRSSSETSGFGGVSTLAVETGAATCMHEGSYVTDVLVRLVVRDFESEKVLVDEKVAIPEGFQPVDCRSDFTEVEEADESIHNGITFGKAQEKFLALLKPETLIVCHSAAKTAAVLKIRHHRWLPLSLLFKTPEKSRKSQDFHARAHLSPAQLRQAMLGEPADNWASETVGSVCLGSIRLTKIACAKFPKPQLEIDAPRVPESLWVAKIPRDFSMEDVMAMFPACGIPKIHWRFELAENDWMGETCVTFSSKTARDQVFEKLPTLSDVFVSWEIADQVTDEILRAVGEKFGKICAVRIPNRVAEGGRPFGFVSFLKVEDAQAMADAKRVSHGKGVLFARLSEGVKGGPFKRVPLQNKAIEVFKM